MKSDDFYLGILYATLAFNFEKNKKGPGYFYTEKCMLFI